MWWLHDQLRHILLSRRLFLSPSRLHAYSSHYTAIKPEKENRVDVSVHNQQDLMGVITYHLGKRTFISCKSWRGTLEVWRPLVALAWLGPIQVLFLFLLFLRLCLRRSWSFLLCFLFVKKQSRLWSCPDNNQREWHISGPKWTKRETFRI